MAATIILAVIAIGLVGGLVYVLGKPSRYSEMTDKEFEEETRKGPGLGGAIIGMERALRRREADFVLEQKHRFEKEANIPGGEPPEEQPPPRSKTSED
jgi:hypothetical protein